MVRYSFIPKATVRELIKQLSTLPPDAVVAAWDPESQKFEKITGLLFTPAEVKKFPRFRKKAVVEICTDEP